jgi:lipopolysaccharide export system permease protein
VPLRHCAIFKKSVKSAKIQVVLRINNNPLKKLDKFVLKSFIGPLVLTFFIVLIILILQFLWMYIDELAGKGLEFKILAELLFQFSLTFVPMALPLAVLLASLMTFGNMGEFSELTAIKSSGIPLRRVMMPVIFLVALVCGISFIFSNNVQPYSYRKARTLLFDIRRKRPELNIQAGTFNNDIDGFSIKIASKNPSTNKLEKLLIYDQREKRGNSTVIYADSGYMKITPDESGMILTLYNGHSYNEMEEKNAPAANRKYPLRKDFFKEQTIVISLTGFDLERSKEDLFKVNSSTQTITQLSHFIDSISKFGKQRKDNYFREFKLTRLYSERNYPQPGVSPIDSASLARLPMINTAAILDTLAKEQKRLVIIKALENARFAVNYLDQKDQYIHNDVKILRIYQVDFYKKFTLAFSCLVFFMIGAPLGAIIRKGGLGTPAVISILFFVVYYVISISAEKMVKEGLVNPFFGMWASCLILLPVGIFLTYKATTDSSIFNTETYQKYLKKIKDWIWAVVFNVKYENPPAYQ